jgi:type II secretion system protein L
MPRTAPPAVVLFDRADAPPPHASEQRRIGLVPADRVSVVAVDLPDLRGARLEQALRWAAEDALAGDAENQHVVPLGRRDDGRMVCAVASRADMRRWGADDPALVALVPDAAALPWQPGELVLVEHGDAVLARWGRHAFDRLDASLLDILLPELIEQAAPAQVRWYGATPPDSVAALDPRHQPAPADLAHWLAEGARDPDVDLLYGDFAPAGRTPAPRRAWTAAMLALAVVLWLGDTALEAVQLDARADALAEEIETRAGRLFPDLQLMPGRERLQIERALAGRSAGGDRFVRTVRRASPLFAGLDAVTVESLSWDEEQLALDVRAPGLPDLEALQAQLEGRGLQVRLDDVAIETGGVRGRLALREPS